MHIAYDAFKSAVLKCEAIQAELAQAKADVAAAQAASAGAATDEDAAAAAAALAAAQAHLAEVQARMDAEKVAFQDAIRELARAYVAYYKKHTNQNGTYSSGGGKSLDVSRDYDFSLNKFLPDGGTLKVKVWHVYHQRL